MIESSPEFQFLGNSLKTFNNNTHQLNVRLDNIFSEKTKWDSMLATYNSMADDLDNLVTDVSTLSSDWKSATDLVYSANRYWNAPIMVVYKRVFAYAANYLEIQNWLDETFPADQFVDTQVIRCEFLCKNYISEALNNWVMITFSHDTVDAIALTYDTTASKTYRYLGLKNHLEGLVSIINGYFRKYNKESHAISDPNVFKSDLSKLITYSNSKDQFQSIPLKEFNESDLIALHSLVTQYTTVFKIYEKTIPLKPMTAAHLKSFDLRDVDVSNAGSFFFKVVVGKWKYYPNPVIDFCANSICSDCYENIDVNTLYTNRVYCLPVGKYIIEECIPPYGGTPLSYSYPRLVDIPDGDPPPNDDISPSFTDSITDLLL